MRKRIAINLEGYITCGYKVNQVRDRKILSLADTGKASVVDQESRSEVLLNALLHTERKNDEIKLNM
jgi:hypothetical protein